MIEKPRGPQSPAPQPGTPKGSGPAHEIAKKVEEVQANFHNETKAPSLKDRTQPDPLPTPTITTTGRLGRAHFGV